MLTSWSAGAVSEPVAVAGNRQHAFAAIDSVEVVEWNGHTGISMSRPGAPAKILTADESARVLDPDTLWLGDTIWRTGGASHNGAGPVVKITHTCPDRFPQPTHVVESGWTMTWRALSDAVFSATGSINIVDLWPEIAHPDWPAFVVRILPVNESRGHPVLSVEAHHAGPLFTTRLADSGNGVYVFEHFEVGSSYSGSIQQTSTGLSVSLAAAAFDTPMGPISLAPVTLKLPEYSHDEQ
jgi:hypothetical protein